MHCPFCNFEATKVTDSRLAGEGRQVRRRRECLSCGERFTTFETAELVMPRIVKNDESREPFDYVWQGGAQRFTASFRCPDTASCIGPPHLFGHVAEGGGLVIDSSRVTRAPLLYVRADH